jgi:hypothetical protein
MHDIKRITACSYGSNKLTIVESNKIDMYIQDAQFIHGIPIDEIVYCSVSNNHIKLQCTSVLEVHTMSTLAAAAMLKVLITSAP